MVTVSSQKMKCCKLSQVSYHIKFNDIIMSTYSAIFQMVGNDNRDPDDSPQARVDKIFDLMDEVRSAAQLLALIDKPEIISAKSRLIKI